VQPLDAATLAALGRQAKRRGAQLAAARGAGRRDAAALLPCVLSKASLEKAGALLLLEAELRGHPELRPLLGRHAPTQPPHGAGAGAGEGQHQRGDGELQQAPAQGHGRHTEQHQLWRRLERAMDAAGDGGGGGGGAIMARRRRRPGRRLSQEERLVLGILGDPRFGFAALTALPYDGSI
jgi:hypothetical protein